MLTLLLEKFKQMKYHIDFLGINAEAIQWTSSWRIVSSFEILRSGLNIGYSYHIYNLLQCQSKCEVDSISVIEDWSLKTIVVFQQVVQQPPFIASTVST